ncbi:MAG: hypothetical protein ABSC89_02720 [Verrucomicrobiota bacterium]
MANKCGGAHGLSRHSGATAEVTHPTFTGLALDLRLSALDPVCG